MTKAQTKTQAKVDQCYCISVQKGAIARLSKIFGKAHLVYFALLLKLPKGRVCDSRCDNIVTLGTRDLEKDGVFHVAFTKGVRILESIGLIKQVEPGEFHGRRPHRFEVLRVPGDWR